MGSISKDGLPSNEEESGWTTYFDDFFNNHKSCWSISSSVVNSSSSLLSDATSLIHLAAKKGTHHSDAHQTCEEEFSMKNKNLSFRTTCNFRKRKKPQSVNFIMDDDDDVLQDTATSPLINSFKKKGSRSGRKEMGLKAGRHST